MKKKKFNSFIRNNFEFSRENEFRRGSGICEGHWMPNTPSRAFRSEDINYTQRMKSKNITSSAYFFHTKKEIV